MTKHANATQIYTDASKIINNYGLGIFCKDYNIAKSYHITNALNIFEAEIAAIWMALNIISTEIPPSNIVLCIDNMAAIKYIENKLNWYKNKFPIGFQIISIINMLNRLGYTIAIQWTPSHIGIKGNDEADRLAKLGTYSSAQNIRIDNHYLENRKNIKEYFNNMWQDEWKTFGFNRFLYKIKPNIKKNNIPFIKNRYLKRIITRFRLGHTTLNSHLFRIKATNDSNCPNCGEYEDITHFVYHCTYYRNIRKKLLTAIPTGVNPFILSNILGGGDLPISQHKTIIFALSHYIKATGRF